MKFLILALTLLSLKANAVDFGIFNAHVISTDQQSQLVVTNATGSLHDAFTLDRGFAGPEVLGLEHFKTKDKDYLFLDFFSGYSGSLSMRACREVYLFSVNRAGKIKKIKSLIYQCSSQDDGQSTGEDNFKKSYILDKSKATLRFSK